MQVVILCGGQGTRIREVAEDLPKPMIPVGGRPILWHIMAGFAAAGFRDFVLCLGYKSAAIKRYFLEHRHAEADLRVELATGHAEVLRDPCGADWRVTLVETGLEAMTGARLKRAGRYLEGEDFLLTYGDGLADVDLPALVGFHRGHGRLGTVTAVRPPGRFGEIELDGRRVSEFSEKPLLSRGRINGGFMAFRRAFLERLPEGEDVVLEQEPLMRLARDGELMAFPHDGFWQCMDSARDHKYLNDLWAAGRAAWKTWDRPAPPRRAAA
jgi:glucose-1-phosphate cytidylyltransferase